MDRKQRIKVTELLKHEKSRHMCTTRFCLGVLVIKQCSVSVFVTIKSLTETLTRQHYEEN